MMTGERIILTLCWLVVGMDLFTNVFGDSLIPAAMCASYIVLWAAGRFKNKKPDTKWIDDLDLPDDAAIVLHFVDKNDKESTIIISESGKVTTDGDVDPALLSGVETSLAAGATPSELAEILVEELNKS